MPAFLYREGGTEVLPSAAAAAGASAGAGGILHTLDRRVLENSSNPPVGLGWGVERSSKKHSGEYLRR